jgi:prevent-host-death family protein
MRRMSATEARIHFGRLMHRVVTEQETVLIERSGEAHVVILSVAEYERLKAAQGAGWQEKVAAARQRALAELQKRPLPPVEELIREMREERNGQLLDLR